VEDDDDDSDDSVQLPTSSPVGSQIEGQLPTPLSIDGDIETETAQPDTTDTEPITDTTTPAQVEGEVETDEQVKGETEEQLEGEEVSVVAPPPSPASAPQKRAREEDEVEGEVSSVASEWKRVKEGDGVVTLPSSVFIPALLPFKRAGGALTPYRVLSTRSVQSAVQSPMRLTQPQL
jgi:hypothetical protein